MKNLKSIVLTLVIAMSITGCSSSQQQATLSEPYSQESTTAPKQQAIIGEGNILVAYFGVQETDGVDTVAGASRVVIDGEILGNTQYVAQIISQKINGDLFSIETVQEYPTTHDALLNFAYAEKTTNDRPELKTKIENLGDYKIIFVGYPNWNADLPMPLYAFFEEYNFDQKIIVPFTTHGGSGLSRTVQTIKELAPNATVVENALSISRNSVPNAKNDVENWLETLE